ncbi:MAG: AAA family ATPase [Sporocytophaga sp.]|nr:AAA family ATPase [Sporocytophaga sp.]
MIDSGHNTGIIENKLRQSVKSLVNRETGARTTRLKPLNKWFELADNQPEVEKLFHNFIVSGEITVVFGDTGIGKTLLAYWLGFKFSRTQRKVFYYCLEMQEKQIRNRYPTLVAPDDFLRADLDPDFNEGGFNFDNIFKSIKSDIEESDGDKPVLILDNLKALSLASMKDNEIAIKVMQALKKLINEYKEKGKWLTIIVLSHVNKIGKGMPLELNHLSGAKELQNFADAIIGFGQSAQDPKLKYLKHLKVRGGVELHQQVLLLQSFNDVEGNHDFKEVGWEDEKLHLPSKASDSGQSSEMMHTAYDMHKDGHSYSVISQQLFGNENHKGTVCKWIQKIKCRELECLNDEEGIKQEQQAKEANPESTTGIVRDSLAWIEKRLDEWLQTDQDFKMNKSGTFTLKNIESLIKDSSITVEQFDITANKFFEQNGLIYTVKPLTRDITPF